MGDVLYGAMFALINYCIRQSDIMKVGIQIICIFLFVFTASAQKASKKAVVLINGTPYLVDVTPKGNITNTYQRINDYFSTSESDANMISRLSKIAEPTDIKIAFFEKEEEPVPSFTAENKVPINISAEQYIGYSPGRALLQKEGVDQIRKIAKAYRAKTISSIRITSYYLDTYRSRSLAQNRAEAIEDLLSAFGVTKSKISIQTLQGGSDTKIDFVHVTF